MSSLLAIMVADCYSKSGLHRRHQPAETDLSLILHRCHERISADESQLPTDDVTDPLPGLAVAWCRTW